MEKVKIPFHKLLIKWTIAYFFAAIMLFFMMFGIFTREWDYLQPILISVYTLIMLLLLFLAYKRYFYVIEKKYVCVVKIFKEVYYNYNEIIYIDFEYSEKKKTLEFVTNKGHLFFLDFDKEGKIYDAFKKNCKNLVSKEDVYHRFPSIKL